MITTNTPLGEDYGYFRGLAGISNGNSVLPPQAIPKKKKNEHWEKTTLDNLEREGLKQYVENLPMTDMYGMLSGNISYMDLLDEDIDSLYSYIQDFKKEKMDIPKYVKHYDLLYPLVSKIVGEWAMQYDKLRFDTTDDVSTNDFIRERTLRLEQYAQAMFKKELDKTMIQLGIDVKEQFNSEEEYQQYQQQLDQVINDYFPDKVHQDLKKNFKTEAAQWAEKTWKRDYERFKMNILESLEARDILLVGKSARHYRIGYDYYFPEYWHPLEVFHSKEASLTRLEDAKFGGRIKWYTITELINNYGDILSEKERVTIYKAFFGEDYTEFSSGFSGNNTNVLGQNYFHHANTPFKGYSDHKMALEFEAATGIALSEHTDLRTGETIPSYSVPLYNEAISYGAKLSTKLRRDIDIRTDTIQTTEAYWKGSKKIGLITYRTVSGGLNTVEVDEDVLPEVIEQYGIKKLRSVSLKEYDMLPSEDKENTLIWVDTPIVYRGVKIRVSGVGLEKDIYKVEELPYQIKGEKGNIFDVKLPICGHIGDSYCNIIRPYQIAYNYFMNQTMSYLQKEIGAFFVIDVNAIPTEYFGMQEGDDALFAIRNIAKTTGLLPTDYSRNTLNQNGGLTFNPMTYQSATFTEPMMRNIQMAEKYKWMAYETLGLTPTSMGNPSQYSTVEGIQVGQKAYFAQTYNIDQVLMENKRSNVEIHIMVAQYCQLNNNDANYLYMASDNELEFLQAIKDENFSLRQIDVRATYNHTKNMMFQQLKQALIQNNTMGNDAIAMVELFMSDDYMELKEAATRARVYAQQQAEADRQHQMKMMEAKDAKEMRLHEDKMTIEREKIAGDIQETEIESLGRASSKDASAESFREINKAKEIALKEQEMGMRNDNERLKIQKDLQIAAANIENKGQQISLQQEKLQLEREKLNNMRYRSDNSLIESIINKN